MLGGEEVCLFPKLSHNSFAFNADHEAEPSDDEDIDVVDDMAPEEAEPVPVRYV